MIDSRWSRDFFWECLVLFTIHYTRGLMFLPSASITCRLIFTKLFYPHVCIIFIIFYMGPTIIFVSILIVVNGCNTSIFILCPDFVGTG